MLKMMPPKRIITDMARSRSVAASSGESANCSVQVRSPITISRVAVSSAAAVSRARTSSDLLS